MNLWNEAFGKVAPGLCRLSMNGQIAVRTGAGYRAYDAKKKQLVNCDSFVLDAGEDFFFVLPANRVRPGDIILSSGIPRCVLDVKEGFITALNYEDATVETLMPEHHLFLGGAFLYGKIVSVFGSGEKKSRGRLIRYMMLSSLMKGRTDGGNILLPLLLGMKGDLSFMDDLLEEEAAEEHGTDLFPDEKED